MLVPDGKGIIHAEVRIGFSIITTGEETPKYPCKGAETMRRILDWFDYVYVDKEFMIFVAVDAGFMMPVEDMFWGGIVWAPCGIPSVTVRSITSYNKKLTTAEVNEGAKAMFARMAEK